MPGNAAGLVAVCLALLWLGYRFYGGFLARSLFETEEDDTPTPATTLEDGVDFVPTNRHVLLGHHFTSVAGAAPIVGPAVACVFGWLPAVLWIVFGVILMGAVQDFGALVVSMRNRGESIGDIAGRLIGDRARVLFLGLIVVLTWLVLAAFASIIGTLFTKFPASVFPINLEVPIALAIGWWTYRKGGGILWPSILAVVVLWGSVGLSAEYEALQWSFPVDGAGKSFLGFTPPQIWVGVLLLYSFVTCVLPVWVLLQPRDFINSHQLFVGLGVIYLAIFLARPEITAPAWNADAPAGVGSLFPMLFVTIACGAISGFHSLVSSGTTSKQIASPRHAKAIGYGSMLGEGALALAATMAVAAGFTFVEWHDHYSNATATNTGGLGFFVRGTANLLERGGDILHEGLIDDRIAIPVVAVIVISFAATTLDTACRIQRFCLAELGSFWRIKPLQNLYVGAAIAAFTPLILVVQKGDGPALWQQVWPVFGAANQMLGALALLVITLWLKGLGKPVGYTGVPAVFLTAVTGTGLVTLIGGQWSKAPEARSFAVLLPATVLLLLAAGILWEGVCAFLRPVDDDARAG